MKQIASLLLFVVVLGLVATPVHADPQRSSAVTCHGGGLTAPPRFGTVPPGVAEYSFSGVCTTRAGQDLGYQATATWTPSESNTANANATEIYRISTLSGPSRSDTVILGARCDSDPWLNPQARCTRLGDNVSEELRGLWPDLASGLFPYSRQAIPYGEQDVLRARYSRANGSSDRVEDPLERVVLNPQPLPPGGMGAETIGTQSSELNVLAVKGPAIANQDPLAMEMRDLQPEGLARRGFDIGMAAAEGQTAPGPGKQRIHDLLSAEEQAGYDAAVAFSLARNRQSGTTESDEVFAVMMRYAKMQHNEARTDRESASSGRFDDLKVGSRTQPANTIRIQVRYPVAYGYRDASALFDPSPNSCSAFYIQAVPANHVAGRELIKIAAEPHMRVSSGMYVCDYLVSYLPFDEPINVRVTMSDQGAAAREAWLDGDVHPSGGQRRSITNGSRQVVLGSDRPSALEVFEMVYAGEPYESDSVTAGAAEGDVIRAQPQATLPESVRVGGRVSLPDTPPRPPRPICEIAREARARNSPAAPGLEAQCLATGGNL